MKQTFVNNLDELMTANENQRIKINYLESQKQKREEYLSGLRESIMLNKQTLIVLNDQGPNDTAISLTSKQNMHLIKLNEQLFNENRQLNALLLMEQQLRIQDKAFYLQRITQFQNRITDLRKYLHDKEESFSSVVSRLKKYEEWGEKPLSQKIQDAQGLRKLTNQVLQKVVIERNMYKAKFEETVESSLRYNVLQSALKNGGSNINRLISQLNAIPSSQQQNHYPQKSFSEHDSPRKQLIQFYTNSKSSINHNNHQSLSKQSNNPHSNFKQTPITKQLMRLLKKEKVNNQILQNALHQAIEKNQQLIQINQNLQIALNTLSKKMEKLIAQNYFFKLKLKQFTSPYGKKYQINTYKDQLSQPSFMKLFSINFQLKNEDNEPVQTRHYRDLLKQSLKEDIQRLLRIPIQMPKQDKRSQGMINNEERNGEEMTTHDMTQLNEKIVQSKGRIKEEDQDAQNMENKKKNHSLREKKVMIKSSSEPRLLITWQATDLAGDDHQAQQIVVDEF